ncbi:competence protein ComK [Sporolactobacillus kofuensis]|uniref:Competence protein ComK n=1 Tax=Sporolactobacillus kofuensis TaxID=269672 RepID=A0ABW1WF46_9BACL|nr:competence protein ComK [Sporolactobacillus kofuensis]MCO7175015.1 competence protein ComK [Sporolactobacillus kofuensis]
MENEKLYIIRPETMALLPYDRSDGSLGTLIIEETRTCQVAQTPLQIVQESCSYYGSTYSGRKKIAMMMGYKSMPPICVCNELGIYFLPLMAEASRNCVWLAHSHIRQWAKSEETPGTIFAYLTHNQKIELPINIRPFFNKVMKTAQYRLQIRERIAPYQILDTGVPRKQVHEHNIRINERGTFFIHLNDEGEDLSEA